MAELDKTISVIESWLKQPVLTPPPINELYDALELLKWQDGTIRGLNQSLKETLDVVSGQKNVLRCKECKYGEKPPTFRYYPNLTWCNKYARSHDDDWFCADGELAE